MLAPNAPKPAHRLVLQSQLAQTEKLWPWIDALGTEYSLAAGALFAVHLCLEEAVSNIIRHGYRNQEGHTILLEAAPEGGTDLVFTICDQASPFNPLTYEPPRLADPPVGLLEPGGHGIRFLRKYSSALGYQRLPDGNRLTIRFSICH